LHRPPPPSAPFVRRLRAVGVGLVALLAWAVAAPAFLPGGALAAGAPAPGLVAGIGAAEPGAAEEARLRALAWQRGREAAAAAEEDLAAAREAAAGAGATTSPAGWMVPPGGAAIPALTLRAYREAAAWAGGFDPGCRLPWTVLAGIGRIESNHGLFGGAATRFSAAGTVSPRITGPALDGNGVASIPDSDGGRWDGDATWDRAVGPMQFIPTTWRSLGRDGNGDRVADPNNLFDAAVSAAGYLCLSGDGDLSDPARLRQAVYGYNHSWAYVDAVLGWARLYQDGVATGPAVATGPPAPSTTATPPGGGPTTTRRPPTTGAVGQPTTTSRRPTTTSPPTTRPPTSTRPPTTTGPPTTGSPTTTTEPCQPTTTSTTTGGSGTTTTSTTTTTTTPGGSTTTTTTLPPCG
jgi:membrane-bound lytic murein transglycosylase B